MPTSELLFIVALAAVNLAAGIGLALVISRRLGAIVGVTGTPGRFVALLVGVYFLECVAFAAGMATQVFSVGLAVLWGIVFGTWLRARRPASGVARTLVLFGVYTSLPAASFGLLLLLAKWLDGANVVSPVDGAALGIPEFVPWPMSTILGFCLVLAVGTLVVKTAVTAGLATRVARSDREQRGDTGGAVAGRA